MKNNNEIKKEILDVKELNKEKQMLELFEVEELEKRYEMGWIKGGSVSAGIKHDIPSGMTSINAGGTINF